MSGVEPPRVPVTSNLRDVGLIARFELLESLRTRRVVVRFGFATRTELVAT